MRKYSVVVRNSAYAIHQQRQKKAALGSSKKRKHEPSTSRTCIRLFVLDYKRVRQRRRRVVGIQSALCEVACEETNRGLDITIVKVYQTVVSTYENRSVKEYRELSDYC